MKIRLTTLMLTLAIATAAMAQTTREEVYADLNKAGGVYYAYQAPTDDSGAISPEGYTPFYISHFGRHGSRYLISDNDYLWVSNLLHKADSLCVLTSKGQSVMERIDAILPLVRGRGGDLSPIGVKQHRGIAERMYKAYPEVFTDSTALSARSTMVVRCVLSMDAFCERLKELNPTLQITRDASHRHLDSLNYHSPESNRFTANDGPWRAPYDSLHVALINSDRLVNSLFSDVSAVEALGKSPDELAWGLYWIAVGMQDIETDVTLMDDVFTPEELFNLWQLNNAGFYMRDASYAPSQGVVVDNAARYVADILHHANLAVASGRPGATLRFAHDGNLIPLTAILKLDGCYESISEPHNIYKVFSDFKISPMAGNVQMIFYRNDSDPDDILVKFLHNERITGIPVDTDVTPFYHWSDVKPYLEEIILSSAH